MPIGLENLALAFGRFDVEQQGPFLSALLAAVDGFLVLDLHNIYCQMENFGLTFDQVKRWYPLERVKSLHVSGGSWSISSYGQTRIRRDTHNGEVPEQVFELVPQALQVCHQVEEVILERLPNTLNGEAEQQRYKHDFYRLKELVESHETQTHETTDSDSESRPHRTSDSVDEEIVLCYQEKLIELFASSRSAVEILKELKERRNLAPLSAYINQLEPAMIEVGQELLVKWGEKESSLA